MKTIRLLNAVIGIDLGNARHVICVLDTSGEVFEQRSIPNTRASLTKLANQYPKSVVAMDELIPPAQELIRSLCHDKDGWECTGSEDLTDDPWGADKLLIFNREDYVVCYVGFRGEQALYALQRIE